MSKYTLSCLFLKLKLKVQQQNVYILFKKYTVRMGIVIPHMTRVVP